MHCEQEVEGEKEEEDDSRKKELYNSLFSRYYGYPIKVIETCCPLSLTRKMRNRTAYSIVFGTPLGSSSL
jgi:hypothetical protein